MDKNRNLVIFELFIIAIIGIFAYVFFSSRATSWQSMQFIASLIFLGVIIPLKLESQELKICMVNTKSAILLGVLAWVLVDPLVLREGLERFTPETVFKAFSMITLFIAMFYISYLARWKPYLRNIFSRLDYGDSVDTTKLFNYALISCIIGLLPVIIWGKSLSKIVDVLIHAGRWTEPWGRAAYGGWSDWFKTGCGFFQILGFQLSIFHFFIAKRKSRVLIILAFLVALFVFNSGTRYAFASLLLPGFVFYYITAFNRKNKKRYLLFVLLYLLLSFLQLQLVVRTSSSRERIGEVIGESFFGIIKTQPIAYHRDDQFMQLLYLAEYVPDKVPYEGEFLILRPLYHFIPRAMWPNKPANFDAAYENALGIRGYTVALSLVGDFFICQGWLGICIIGVFMGFLAKQFDLLIEMSKHSPAVLFIYSYGLVFLFTTIRGYQILYEGWYIFIFMYIALKKIKLQKRTQSESCEY